MRGLREFYEPVLTYCLHSLGPLVWLLAALAVMACAALGLPLVNRCAIVVGVAVHLVSVSSDSSEGSRCHCVDCDSPIIAICHASFGDRSAHPAG